MVYLWRIAAMLRGTWDSVIIDHIINVVVTIHIGVNVSIGIIRLRLLERHRQQHFLWMEWCLYHYSEICFIICLSLFIAVYNRKR